MQAITSYKQVEGGVAFLNALKKIPFNCRDEVIHSLLIDVGRGADQDFGTNGLCESGIQAEVLNHIKLNLQNKRYKVKIV